MARPHKIEASKMTNFLASHYVEYASATTSDGTQRKTIGRRGSCLYIVTRRYLKMLGEAAQPVYEGPDIDEAVRLYNGLG